MGYVMNKTQGRRKSLDMMRQALTPLSGGALNRETGVGRQVVVRDITLLHAMGYPILSTARGYIPSESEHVSRLFKVCHANEQIGDELVTIVDLSGTVADVMINHRVYEKISTPLNIRDRHDVQLLMDNTQAGESTPLINVASDYHFHHVYARQEEMLDEIGKALKERHYLIDLLPYEMFNNG